MWSRLRAELEAVVRERNDLNIEAADWEQAAMNWKGQYEREVRPAQADTQTAAAAELITRRSDPQVRRTRQEPEPEPVWTGPAR